jgi:hypothetical protein
MCPRRSSKAVPQSMVCTLLPASQTSGLPVTYSLKVTSHDISRTRQQSRTPEHGVYLIASYSHVGFAGDADIGDDLT